MACYMTLFSIAVVSPDLCHPSMVELQGSGGGPFR